jgi:hypothetical protein
MNVEEQINRVNQSKWTFVVIVVATTLYLLLFVNWQTALGYVLLLAVVLPITIALKRRRRSND